MTVDQGRAGSGPGPSHFMHHVKSSPPVPLLREWVARLESRGVPVALGGSGLLAALGLTDTIRDWDLTTDAPWERALEAVSGGDVVAHGPDELHADRKVALAGGALELIVGFAFHGPGGAIHIPTIVSARVEGIPIGSPEAWAVAYHLMGRGPKSEALFDYLERRGATRATVARLLQEPLPPAVAGRLAALPTSSAT